MRPVIRICLFQTKSTPVAGFPGDPQIVPFWDVVSRGKKVCESPEVQPVTPGPTDIGIIMYTSGSTGTLPGGPTGFEPKIAYSFVKKLPPKTMF